MIEVEGINISITGDTAKFDAAAKRVEARMKAMAGQINADARKFRDGFESVGNALDKVRNQLEAKGIPATRENVRAVLQALKEIEREEKKAAADKKKADEEADKRQRKLYEEQVRGRQKYNKEVTSAREKQLKEWDKQDKEVEDAKYRWRKTRDKIKARDQKESDAADKEVEDAKYKWRKARQKIEVRDQKEKAAAEKEVEDGMYKWRRAQKKQQERDYKNHLKAIEKAEQEARKAQEKAEHAQSTIANKSALYGGLFSGTLVGGRFGFASGFFGGRVGAAVGGAIGGAGSMASRIGGVAGAGAGLALAAGAKILVAYLETAYALMEKIGSAAYSFLVTSLKLGLEHEKQITSLRIMSGGKEKGDKLYGQIEKIAIDSPYRTTELLKQGEILLGSGVSPENLPAYLSRIGDMSGGNMNRFHLIAKAMADVKAVGHLRGQELNQFANQGYGAAFFAKNLGMEPEVFKRKMSQNEITVDKVAGAINRSTDRGGALYGKSREIATTTVGGALESIGETIESFQKKFGEMILHKFNIAGLLNKVLAGFNNLDMKKVENWVDRTVNAFTPLGQTLVKFGDYVINFGESMYKALPSVEEFVSVLSDNVDKFLPPLINTFKTLGIVTLALGRAMLVVSDWFIKMTNAVTQSQVFKKIIGDVGEIPTLARGGTVDKWMKNMQDALKKAPDPNKIVDGRVGPNGPLGRLINGKSVNRNGVDPDKINESAPRFDKETQDLAEKVSKEVKEGIHPFQKFDIGMKRLLGAFKPKDGGAPLIDKAAFQTGSLGFMRTLESDMKGYIDKSPVTAEHASSTAQEIINANITMQRQSVQERTLMVIEAAKTVLENQLKVDQDILKAVSKSYGLNEDGL